MNGLNRAGLFALASSMLALVEGLVRGGSWAGEAWAASRIGGLAWVLALIVWGLAVTLVRGSRVSSPRAFGIVVSWWCWVASVHAIGTWLAARYRDPELVALALTMASVVLAWMVGGLVHPLVERAVFRLEPRTARASLLRVGAAVGLVLALSAVWTWSMAPPRASSSKLAAAVSSWFGLRIGG